MIDPGNEYDQLNSAFDRLSDEVSRIQRQMLQVSNIQPDLFIK